MEASLSDLIDSVRAQGLEGLIAKRRDSRYEPGQRSGAWQKMRINQGQEFVIGGYTVGGATFDALIFDYLHVRTPLNSEAAEKGQLNFRTTRDVSAPRCLRDASTG